MEQEVVTVGLDLAKNVFQVHAIAANGAVLIRRKLRRSEVIQFSASCPPCLIGMEACASAHHWARELIAIGHTVRLMPPAYVKPYVKRGILCSHSLSLRRARHLPSGPCVALATTA